jgi:hypothetical protein
MNTVSKNWRLVITSLLVSLLYSGAAAQPLETDGTATSPVIDRGSVFSNEPMTPELFRQIVAKPGDHVLLIPELSDVPIWTNADVHVVMKYASGRTFTEKVMQTTHTVDGKYIIYTINSDFYHQTMSSIMAFDEKASTLKVYGLYSDSHGGDAITESAVVYDYAKKTYTGTSSYGDGFKEITTGSYNSTNDFSHTLVYKNGALFMTREVSATCASPAN